jgi:hypothetical protein
MKTTVVAPDLSLPGLLIANPLLDPFFPGGRLPPPACESTRTEPTHVEGCQAAATTSGTP